MSIMFNEICINEEMLPKYTYIYIYIYIYISIQRPKTMCVDYSCMEYIGISHKSTGVLDECLLLYIPFRFLCFQLHYIYIYIYEVSV